MSKLSNNIRKMKFYIKVIEEYNRFRNLGAEEDLEFLKLKVDNLFTLKDNNILIEQFEWCSKMLNMYYNEIEYDFKKKYIEDEKNEL